MKVLVDTTTGKKKINKEAVINICQKHFAPDDVFENITTRKRPYVLRRQLTMYMLRKFTKLSLAEIGQVFKKDHATALHAVKCMEVSINHDLAYLSDIRLLYVAIRSDVLKVIDKLKLEDNSTIEERLLKEREVNQRLVQREIHRREQLMLFRQQLRYIPDRYVKRIIKIVEECIAPLSH